MAKFALCAKSRSCYYPNPNPKHCIIDGECENETVTTESKNGKGADESKKREWGQMVNVKSGTLRYRSQSAKQLTRAARSRRLLNPPTPLKSHLIVLWL